MVGGRRDQTRSSKRLGGIEEGEKEERGRGRERERGREKGRKRERSGGWSGESCSLYGERVVSAFYTGPTHLINCTCPLGLLRAKE